MSNSNGLLICFKEEKEFRVLDSIVAAGNCLVAVWLSMWFIESGNFILIVVSISIAMINFMYFALFWFDDDTSFSDEELADLFEA
jgi:hypothetical protein